MNNKLRKLILQASYDSSACHIGSSLSCIDIIKKIYNTKKPEDIFLFAKASGVCALYVVLAEKGIIPKNKVAYYLKKYPLVNKSVPSVIWSGGSLGHGLPVAVGLALADRKRKVYVLMGDSEIQEGTTWESILFARQHKLKNLKIIVDDNGLQACGKTEDILGIEKALELLKQLFPIKVVKTIKGQGVSFMRGDFRWHYFNLDKVLLRKALKEL